MRRCRVTFVSPPETNNNSECFVITTKCNCISNKYNSPSTIKAVNLMFSTIIKTNHVNDVLLIFELLFQRIHNFYTSDACVYCLAVIYSYFSCISVIVNHYNIKRLCLIKRLICIIIQLSLPKKLTEPRIPRTSYLKSSEKVRVVYPLSK